MSFSLTIVVQYSTILHYNSSVSLSCDKTKYAKSYGSTTMFYRDNIGVCTLSENIKFNCAKFTKGRIIEFALLYTKLQHEK